MVLEQLRDIGKLLGNREDRMETGIVAPTDIELLYLAFVTTTL